jgi:hypothetical protein
LVVAAAIADARRTRILETKGTGNRILERVVEWVERTRFSLVDRDGGGQLFTRSAIDFGKIETLERSVGSASLPRA